MHCSPDTRYTAVQALGHPYFHGLHDPGDEPLLPSPFPSDPELDVMPVGLVRAEMFKEMLEYNADLQFVGGGVTHLGAGGGFVGLQQQQQQRHPF